MAQPYDYDVVVVGAGIAGMVSAVTANALGKRVAVIEKRKVGGNCTNFTCIPSKALIRLSRSGREISKLAARGLFSKESTTWETSNIMPHIRSIVKSAYEKDVPETFEQIGISILSGSASFTDRHHVEVNGRTVSASRFILAVGTRPVIPPITGINDVDYLTNETLYELDDLPKSIIILGGGVDGLEYGSAFAGLGVETTVVEMGAKLLPGADRELVNHLLRELTEGGLRLMTGTKAKSMRNHQGKVVLDYETADGAGEIQADRVLAAVGRKPDFDELLLHKAGVNCTQRGVIVDDTLRTSAPNIYACGDIAGPDQLASTAEYQGIVASTNSILPIKQRVDYRNNVYVIFTEPTLAFLGLTEAQAHAKYGHKLKVYRFDYAGMRRSLIDGNNSGLAKFLCDGRGRLIGAHILGEAAAEVIHEAQVIRAFKKPLHKLNLVTHAYPTYAQALVGRAGQLAFLDKMGSNFFVNTALRIWPGLENRLALARDRLAEKHPVKSGNMTSTTSVVRQNDAKPANAFEMKAVYLNGNTCMIDVPETLMDHNESPFVNATTWNNGIDPGHLVLNFSRVRKINGLGASMLVKFAALASRKGQVVSACGLSQDLKQVFQVTELDKAIRVHNSETEAHFLAGASGEQSQNHGSQEPCGLSNLKCWANPVSELFVPDMPKEARNLNVNGLRPVGPVNGFGRLCQKVFTLAIGDSSISPEQAVAALKENFPDFQPSFNRFYPSGQGIKAGEVVLIDSSTPGGPVSTGVMVLYSDELSFTFNTPQGHPECGFVSFTGHSGNSGAIVRIVGLARAGDPIYEAAFRLVGSRIQTRIWTHVLTSLAVHLGVPADITFRQDCFDTDLRWSQLRNVYYNAQIRTLIREPERLLSRFREMLRR